MYNDYDVTLQSVPGVSMLELIRYQSGASSGIIVFFCLQEVRRAIRSKAEGGKISKDIALRWKGMLIYIHTYIYIKDSLKYYLILIYLILI